jgi:hypothetical protein
VNNSEDAQFRLVGNNNEHKRSMMLIDRLLSFLFCSSQDVHRCRLLRYVDFASLWNGHSSFMLFRRGIPAQPILNGYCGNYEVGMTKSLINHPQFNYDHPTWMETLLEQSKTKQTSLLSHSTMHHSHRMYCLVHTFIVAIVLVRYYQ